MELKFAFTAREREREKGLQTREEGARPLFFFRGPVARLFSPPTPGLHVCIYIDTYMYARTRAAIVRDVFKTSSPL